MKIIIIIALCLPVKTAFESGFTDPELIFPYIRAVQDTGSPVCVINPALLPFCTGITATAAGGRPYYGYGLDSAYAAAQYSGKGYGLSFRWNSFGDNAYRENTFSAGAGFRPLHWLAAGAAADLYKLAINCDSVTFRETLYDYGAGVVIMPAWWFQSGFMVRNIRALTDEDNTIYGEWSGGLLAKPCRGLSLSWNISDNPAGMINTFTLTVNPLKNISSGFGYSVETSSFGMDLGIMCGQVEFNYGLRFHPYLGYSHAVGITYSGSGVTEPLAYGKTGSMPLKRINIQGASYDELMSLGILSDTSARRIILYREQIGPLSRNSLARIGLAQSEIKALLSAAYGFEKDVRPGFHDLKKESKKRKTGRSLPRKVVTKHRFGEMIDQGIPAYQAALYSDMCTSGVDEYPETLSVDVSLSEEQKATIRRICGR